MNETRNKENTPDVSSQHSVKDVEAEFNLGSQIPVLAKSFNLLSACATGMTTGNAWAVLGGGIVRAHSSRWTVMLRNMCRLPRCTMADLLVSYMNCTFRL